MLTLKKFSRVFYCVCLFFRCLLQFDYSIGSNLTNFFLCLRVIIKYIKLYCEFHENRSSLKFKFLLKIIRILWFFSKSIWFFCEFKKNRINSDQMHACGAHNMIIIVNYSKHFSWLFKIQPEILYNSCTLSHKIKSINKSRI